MRFTFAATALLMIASSVEAATTTLRTKKLNAFRKAMEPNRFDNEARKGQIMKKLLSKAKPGNDVARKLDENENEEDWADFGFDVSAFSIKYSGCSAVQTYSSEMAENEDATTVLTARRFVMFRLCPTDSCNKYSVGGCTENYGEYLVELEDYLASVSEYYEEKNEKYCEYCNECYNGGQNNNGNDDGDNANDDGDNANRRRLDDGDNADDADDADDADNGNNQNDDGNQCDEDLCSGSYDICNENNGDDNLDAREFMACAAVQVDDDEEYYIAPHCASDRFSITLGVYSDEYCDTFLPDMTLSAVLGYNLDTSVFDNYFPRECISCEEVAYQNNNNDDADADNINELCENLYSSSAKCNKNLDNANDYSYQGDNQASQGDTVCAYITSLQQGTYSESGEIVLNNDWYFNVSNWRDADEYMKEFNNVKYYASHSLVPWQIAALVASVVGCLIMWVWICCLRSALGKKNIPWRPRRSKDTPPGDLSRQNSGIVLGRSRSGPGTTPLI